VQIPADSLRAVLDSVFRDPAYAWDSPSTELSWVAEHWLALLSWLSGLEGNHPTVYRIFIALLVALLVVILAHGAWILVRTVRGAAPPSRSDGPATEVQVRDAAWYWREADRLAAAQRYPEAAQVAFIALARDLDRRGLLQYQPSQTPAEVARSARLSDEGRGQLRSLVSRLYLAAFGGGQFGAAEWTGWREQAGQEWHAAAS
jgi:hypothetical protein